MPLKWMIYFTIITLPLYVMLLYTLFARSTIRKLTPGSLISARKNISLENCWTTLMDKDTERRKCSSQKQDYVIIPYKDANDQYTSHKHASHGMLYAKTNSGLWNIYLDKAFVLKSCNASRNNEDIQATGNIYWDGSATHLSISNKKWKAAVMSSVLKSKLRIFCYKKMQMRYDGHLGFPGGVIRRGEEPVAGLNREMKEEIALDLKHHSFENKHHVVTLLDEEKQLVLHFFIKEITLDDFKYIEENHVNAEEFGIENLGSFRPPLYTMGDNFGGFPTFLCNRFIGNSKMELLCGLIYTNIFTKEEISNVLQLAEHCK